MKALSIRRGSPEPLLFNYVISTLFTWFGSNMAVITLENIKTFHFFKLKISIIVPVNSLERSRYSELEMVLAVLIASLGIQD